MNDGDHEMSSIEQAAKLLDREIKLRLVDPEVPPEPPDMEFPPVEEYAKTPSAPSHEESDGEHKVGEVRGDKPLGNVVDFARLASTPAPEFAWLVPGWLSAHPTLLSGKGGMGKSLCALQMAVALASGQRFIGRAVDPMRVVLWSCEEDLSELHRRLERICAYYEIPLSGLGENLLIDCRHGLDSTLMSTEFGRPLWTGLTEYLREQVNDWRADVWVGDNLAHMYAASENERHPVTVFTSWLSGLRPSWCPLLVGHVAKAGGSEYSGSTAWENAVRMRWYLGDKLPDQDQSEDDDEPGMTRFLCKRKTNYDVKDFMKFSMDNGIFVPDGLADIAPMGAVEAGARARRAQGVVLRGLAQLTEMNINTTHKGGQSSLVKQLRDYKLAEGETEKSLRAAMRELMLEGKIKYGPNGKDAYRRQREGLVIVTGEDGNA